MGTDFRYEDLENRKKGQDSVVIIGNEYFQGSQCKVLMAYPKDESIYFSRKIWIDTFNWNIQKIEFYLTELKKEKTLTFSEFITVDKYMTPGILTMDIEDEKNKTIMIIKSFKPNIGLKDEIFTESFLVKNQLWKNKLIKTNEYKLAFDFHLDNFYSQKFFTKSP